MNTKIFNIILANALMTLVNIADAGTLWSAQNISADGASSFRISTRSAQGQIQAVNEFTPTGDFTQTRLVHAYPNPATEQLDVFFLEFTDDAYSGKLLNASVSKNGTIELLPNAMETSGLSDAFYKDRTKALFIANDGSARRSIYKIEKNLVVKLFTLPGWLPEKINDIGHSIETGAIYLATDSYSDGSSSDRFCVWGFNSVGQNFLSFRNSSSTGCSNVQVNQNTQEVYISDYTAVAFPNLQRSSLRKYDVHGNILYEKGHFSAIKQIIVNEKDNSVIVTDSSPLGKNTAQLMRFDDTGEPVYSSTQRLSIKSATLDTETSHAYILNSLNQLEIIDSVGRLTLLGENFGADAVYFLADKIDRIEHFKTSKIIPSSLGKIPFSLRYSANDESKDIEITAHDADNNWAYLGGNRFEVNSRVESERLDGHINLTTLLPENKNLKWVVKLLDSDADFSDFHDVMVVDFKTSSNVNIIHTLNLNSNQSTDSTNINPYTREISKYIGVSLDYTVLPPQGGGDYKLLLDVLDPSGGWVAKREVSLRPINGTVEESIRLPDSFAGYDYRLQAKIVAPGDSWQEAIYDVGSFFNLGYSDRINSVTPLEPESFSANGEVSVSVDYVASVERDIEVFLLEYGTWNFYGSARQSVDRGTSQTTMRFSVQNAPKPGSSYFLSAKMIPQGKNWEAAMFEYERRVHISN